MGSASAETDGSRMRHATHPTRRPIRSATRPAAYSGLRDPRRPAVDAGRRVALEQRQRLDAEVGMRQCPGDADPQQRGAGREAQVADDREVEAVAAQQRLEVQVHVGLRVERAVALEAERVAGELDRVEVPQRRARS